MIEKIDSLKAVEGNRCVTREQLKLMIAGNHDAFRLVYDAYHAKIFRLAFRYLKDRTLSQEIVQETFIKLWTVKHNVQEDKEIWYYLSVIAKRLALNSLRNISKSEILTSELFFNIKAAHNATEENLYARDLELATEKLIKNLPKQQQIIYQLSRAEGLSHKEIAEQLHISPSTVNNHLVQALKTLKSNLDNAFLALIFLVVIWIQK